MKKIYYLVIPILTLSCAKPPILIINSSTPAIIEKNGIRVCETTPCTITASHYINGFGECISLSQTDLQAFPINKKKGFRQEKKVFAGCDNTYNIFFDMDSIGSVGSVYKK